MSTTFKTIKLKYNIITSLLANKLMFCTMVLNLHILPDQKSKVCAIKGVSVHKKDRIPSQCNFRKIRKKTPKMCLAQTADCSPSFG